ncbi:MAG TPA: hypothetical protein VNX28_18940 [Gemmataceae bacterium]|nr:hypothetical protein [Gemmataceae bacterium]
MTPGLLLGVIDVTATVLSVLHIGLALGGVVVGWFVSGPVIRLLYRGAFRRPVPGWLMPWARLGGSALVGLLVFYFLPLGWGGGGGWGWGLGAGGGPGLGTGDGSGYTKAEKAAIADKDGENSKKNDVEALEIELVGGTRYQGEGRFYLIKRRQPPVNLGEVEDFIKKNKERLAEYVTIILTPESVAAQHGAVLRLVTIIEDNDRIPQVKNVNAAPGN